jgi:hypothetical protein
MRVARSPAAGRPLSVPPDAVCGMSRIDASGRLTSQAVSHVLNWQTVTG